MRTTDVVRYSGPLFRIHTTVGAHPSTWDEFRRFGPIRTMRWDHHSDPAGMHPGHGIMYTAADPTTAFAEVFQGRTTIRVSPKRTFSAWEPIAPIRLLDMTQGWLGRNGASWSLTSASKRTCRNWARAIHDELGEAVEGLLVPSTMTGRPNVILFESAAGTLPSAPAVSRPLDHPAIAPLIARASHELGKPIR